MPALNDFQQIIRTWARRRDPTAAYTPNQIANFALRGGTPRNSARVGQAANAYLQYFRVQGFGHARRISVNWEAIRRDHPDLLPGAITSAPARAGRRAARICRRM